MGGRKTRIALWVFLFCKYMQVLFQFSSTSLVVVLQNSQGWNQMKNTAINYHVVPKETPKSLHTCGFPLYRRNIYGLNTCRRHLERNAEQWQKHSHTRILSNSVSAWTFMPSRVCISTTLHRYIYFYTYTPNMKIECNSSFCPFLNPHYQCLLPHGIPPKKTKECGGFGEFNLLYTDESLKPFESHFSKPTVPLAKVDGGLFKTMWFGWGPFRESGMELGMYTVYSLF